MDREPGTLLVWLPGDEATQSAAEAVISCARRSYPDVRFDLRALRTAIAVEVIADDEQLTALAEAHLR